MKSEHFSDNIKVGGGKGRNDYFQVVFREATDAESPSTISLTRYSVPGRYDTYNFDFAPSRSQGYGDRVRFFTDTNTTMVAALAMLKLDLDKPQVVKLLTDAAKMKHHRRYAIDLHRHLLRSVAPSSKAALAVGRLAKKFQKELDDWLARERK